MKVTAPIAAFLLGSLAYPQAVVHLISKSSSGTPASDSARDSATSSDGRFTVFSTVANNLANDDFNSASDVFRHDLLTGVTELVSQRFDSPLAANGASGQVDISANGRWVVFASAASDLVPGDSNGLIDVFLRDMETNTCELISQPFAGSQTQGSSGSPRISPNGRFFVFSSSLRLLPEDVSLGSDIYLFDRPAGALSLISGLPSGQPHGGGCSDPDLSDDGRFITFLTSSSLISGAPPAGYDEHAVRLDRQTGQVDLVNVTPSGEISSREPTRPRISGDGQSVVFQSFAKNLIPTTEDISEQVFLKSFPSGDVTLITVDLFGAPAGGGGVSTALPTYDGTQVFFESSWPFLVQGDLNGTIDVFERDTVLDVTTRVNLTDTGAEIDGVSELRSVASSGDFVVFSSRGSNITGSPPGPDWQLYLRDRGDLLGSFPTYCDATPNSSGERAAINAIGSTDPDKNRLALGARGLPVDAFGFFLASRLQGLVLNPAGSAGNLCLGGSIGRFVGPGQILNSGDTGTFSLQVDLTSIPQPSGAVAVTAGETWNFQAWMRDSIGGTATSNFTNGLEAGFQ